MAFGCKVFISKLSRQCFILTTSKKNMLQFLFFNPLCKNYSLGLKFLLIFDLDAQMSPPPPRFFFGAVWICQLISCSSIPELS